MSPWFDLGLVQTMFAHFEQLLFVFRNYCDVGDEGSGVLSLVTWRKICLSTNIYNTEGDSLYKVRLGAECLLMRKLVMKDLCSLTMLTVRSGTPLAIWQIRATRLALS